MVLFSFDKLKKITLGEKEKMLVTRIFSFSRNVFESLLFQSGFNMQCAVHLSAYLELINNDRVCDRLER